MKPLHAATLTLTAGLAGSAWATQYLSVEQAQRVMFPDATSFQPADLQLNADQMQAVETLAGLPARSAHWRVFAAQRGDARLGYVILDNVVGKFELISYAVAVDPDASIKQVEILAYRESHGFEIRNAAWRRQFVGKTARSGIEIDNGIANISGATLSCTHLTDGVRRIAAVAQVMLKK